jgi:hypothetical protein
MEASFSALSPQATKKAVVTKNDIDEMKLRFVMMFSFRADERPNDLLIRLHYEANRSIGSSMKVVHAFRPSRECRS